ncbi:protein CASC3 [Phlebotomus argentipes]|uniref:protein CASC3 n=1 Tax=Phlebotomus argentipes TaxID=94469 RepID=UPI002893806E|nr:protein CASC3 [Phlebotomus argentipes]
MESVAKSVSVESSAARDAGSAEYAEDLTEQETCAESCQHDSEYNTASDSTTSETGIEKVSQKAEVIEISDDEENDDDDAPDDEEDDEEEEEEDVSSMESGEEDEENPEMTQSQILEAKRQVDDDEDRSNPQYIPKRGTFYEHDDRTAENADGETAEAEIEGEGSEKKVSFSTPAPAAAKSTKKWQSSGDRWSHDRYDESEQAPKSKAELVSAYGYDIRNEESPPRARRRRRYGRGPSKYTRKWEDENAYSKASTRRIALNNKEEFPEIDENPAGRARRRGGDRKMGSDEHEHYSGKSQAHYDEGYARSSHDNNQLKPKNLSSGFRVKSSIEFKNQNRLRQQNANAASGVEHNRADSFIITRNNNVPVQEGGAETHLDHADERGGDYKGRQLHQQPMHGINGNEFAEFMPNYMHGQMGADGQHGVHRAQLGQQGVMLPRDLPLNYGGDSVKAMQHQRNHSGAAASNNLAPMGINSDNMRQTPKRYSSLRQRAVMSTNAQVPGQMVASSEREQQERLKVSPPLQKQPPAGLSDTHEMGESPKMKLRQPKSHHSQSPTQQPLQTAQQPPLPQSTNFYPPDFIRQPPLPAHRATPQAAAKNHASIPGQAYQPQFAANNTTPAFVPPAQTTPAFIAPPPQSTNPQQILNYVPPPNMGPTPAQFPTYPNYPNYNSMTTPSIPHQSQGGITYYAPQSQQQPRAVVAQRRPTNAIPILAPPERSGKGRGRLPSSQMMQMDRGDSELGSDEGKSNVENIDHILDNMFTRRTPYEPPSLKPSSSPPPVSPVVSKAESGGVELAEEGLKNLSVASDQQLVAEVSAKSQRTEESPASDPGQEDN